MAKTSRVSKDSADVKLNYVAQGQTLREFHDVRCDYFTRNLIGPLGSGKTQACILEVLDHIHNQVPAADNVRYSRVCVVRNTFPDLDTSTIPDFRAVVDPMGIGEFKNASPPRWTCNYARNDGTTVKGEVIFRSFDGKEDEKKARGMQLSGCWFNEMKELNKANVDLVSSRVGRYPPRAKVRSPNTMIISDSNAPDRDHWLGKSALETKPKGWWFGIQPAGVLKQGTEWVQNPKAENGHNLPPNYYNNLVSGRADTWVRKNLANEFIYHTDNRPVHPDFGEAMHVMACGPTPGTDLHIGIDFGRTPAAAIMQRQTNGQWYVLRELCTKNMGAERFGELLDAYLNEHYAGYHVTITGDPAGDDMAQTRDETPFDLLRSAGLDAMPAPTNDPLERYAALDGLLRKNIEGQPAIVFDPKCATLIRGLAGAFCFKRIQVANDERYRDKADKGPESHVCEALHYGLLGAGESQTLYHQDDIKYDSGDWHPNQSQFE